jgi:hypothetical protein
LIFQKISVNPPVAQIQQQVGHGQQKKNTGGIPKKAGGGKVAVAVAQIDPAADAQLAAMAHRERINERKRAFQESRVPEDADMAVEFEGGTTGSDYMWSGWHQRKFVFP